MLENRLPDLLDQKNISIRELARRTGITYTTIRAVVKGERRSIQLDVLENICLILEIQPGDIYIAGDDSQSPATPATGVPDSQTRRSDIGQSRARKSSVPTISEAGSRRRKRDMDWRSW